MKTVIIFFILLFQMNGFAQMNPSTNSFPQTQASVFASCNASCCVLGHFNTFTDSEFSQIIKHVGEEKTDLRKLQSYQYLFTDAKITYDQLVEMISLMKRDRMKLKLIDIAVEHMIDVHRVPLLIFLFDKKSFQRRLIRLTRDKKITTNTLNTP